MATPSNLFDLGFEEAVAELEKVAAEKRAGPRWTDQVKDTLVAGRNWLGRTMNQGEDTSLSRGLQHQWDLSKNDTVRLSALGGAAGAGVGAVGGGLIGRGGLANAGYGAMLGGALGAAGGGGVGLLRSNKINAETDPERALRLQKEIAKDRAGLDSAQTIAGATPNIPENGLSAAVGSKLTGVPGIDWAARQVGAAPGGRWLADQVNAGTDWIGNRVNAIAPPQARGVFSEAKKQTFPTNPDGTPIRNPDGTEKTDIMAGLGALRPKLENFKTNPMLDSALSTYGATALYRKFLRNPMLIADKDSVGDATKAIYSKLPYWSKMRAQFPLTNGTTLLGRGATPISAETMKSLSLDPTTGKPSVEQLRKAISSKSGPLSEDAQSALKARLQGTNNGQSLLNKWTGTGGRVSLNPVTQLKHWIAPNPASSPTSAIPGAGAVPKPLFARVPRTATEFTYPTGGVLTSDIRARLNAAKPSLGKSLLSQGVLHGAVQLGQNYTQQARGVLRQGPEGAAAQQAVQEAIQKKQAELDTIVQGVKK